MTTPKKKHLIELMIEAGVKWPENAKYAAQDKDKLCVRFYEKGKPFRSFGMNYWDSTGGSLIRELMVKLPKLCRNWHQTIVTREQYAKALANSTTTNDEWEPVEWGDWSIGDIVRFDGFTDPTHDHWSFKVGVLYVVGKHNAPIAGNCQYPERNWGFSFSRRKKQNEQHIEVQPSPEYCASVMRQMPNNTIEQLTADYHTKTAEAQRQQTIADEARKTADDALLALEKAGELLGLIISIDTNK